jgi:hypothetical protein
LQAGPAALPGSGLRRAIQRQAVSYEKYYKMSFKGGKCFAVFAMGLRIAAHTPKKVLR